MVYCDPLLNIGSAGFERISLMLFLWLVPGVFSDQNVMFVNAWQLSWFFENVHVVSNACFICPLKNILLRSFERTIMSPLIYNWTNVKMLYFVDESHIRSCLLLWRSVIHKMSCWSIPTWSPTDNHPCITDLTFFSDVQRWFRIGKR